MTGAPRLAIVIPCYRVAATLAGVVAAAGPSVWRIYCVDDASPDATRLVIEALAAADPRVRLVARAVNGGVGAAVLSGYRAAIADGATVIVKVDGDGQMNAAFAADFAAPILAGDADYVKGNRFFNLAGVRAMPASRIVGNAGLSFFSKLSSGYWDLFDPTNGYTAIHAGVAALLPFHRIHPRYFFESDVLFRLSTLRARVVELPLETIYGGETSHLSEARSLLTFPLLHARNFAKRLFYNYFLRNFSIASLNLVVGLALLLFGLGFGIAAWSQSLATGAAATAGTVMLAALPFMTGVQLTLNFLSFDLASTPATPIHPRLASKRLLITPLPVPEPEHASTSAAYP